MTEFTNDKPLVFTVKDRCRVCYTCVRDCPVKAIKIIDGQAEVIFDRCIACGNCVKVCSQGAKTFFKSNNEVLELLKSGEKVIACVAPSFPAEFIEIKDYKYFVGMLREMGFDKVVEVSFGADIVAKKYTKLLDESKDRTIISSDCPGIVNYIQHYHPDLVECLAPIASPMLAMTRIVKEKYGDDCKAVLIGPCIAKKAESDEFDQVLTFVELRELFEELHILPETCKPSEFDPPHSGKGAMFPVSRGLIHNMGKMDKILDGDIIVTHGHVNFREAIDELESGSVDVGYMELLCCRGCIMGPGMTKNGKRFKRRSLINDYVNKKLENLDKKTWEADLKTYCQLDFSETFAAKDRRNPSPDEDQINTVLETIGKSTPSDYLNCGACGYATCREHAVAILEGLAEPEMCLPYTIEKLHQSIDQLNVSNSKLANAKQALKQSEKLAHMGQLSAGIAHELNNPLGVITMYSNLLKEETNPDSDTYKDLEMVVEQAERCKKIVGGLLNFARKNQVKKRECNIVDFAKHSLNSVIAPENIKISFSTEIKDPKAYFDPDQMMQVLTNLEKNAVEAMPLGGELKLSLQEDENSIIIIVSDTGTGISKTNMDKIFTPFFTTKELGKGTGLGLPLIYGIVKMHNGKIIVASNDDSKKGPTGTSFTINIPRNN
ncbi:MAG: [Fe-Fe] hydrogenase large subunit C-terminal domain-containing protein [Bacteroidales bacterium]|nr:[Fe-Fe] hydrogenase large subunit C-terminal domain-containing protein [Bacteroidales bacterium]